MTKDGRTNSQFSSSREIFLALDALRGLAAIGVLTTHADDYFGSFALRGGHLAVDLFFCISGAVISHAYGPRMDQGLSSSMFMRLRLIRLFPLMLLSVVLVAGPALIGIVRGKGTLSEVALIVGPSALALPNPLTSELFPANVALWSLFFELVINLIAAIFWRTLSTSRLIGLVGLSAVALCVVSGDGLTGGPTWDSFHTGLARASFSFFAGMLVYRLCPKFPVVMPTAILLVIVAVVLALAPALGRAGPLLSVLIVFPAVVAAGMAVQTKFGTVYALLGRLSYAFYVLQIPLIILFRKAAGPGAPLLGLVLFLVAASYFADRWFDTPARKFLLKLTKSPRD